MKDIIVMHGNLFNVQKKNSRIYLFLFLCILLAACVDTRRVTRKLTPRDANESSVSIRGQVRLPVLPRVIDG